jgi:hypothetical protein
LAGAELKRPPAEAAEVVAGAAADVVAVGAVVAGAPPNRPGFAAAPPNKDGPAAAVVVAVAAGLADAAVVVAGAPPKRPPRLGAAVAAGTAAAPPPKRPPAALGASVAAGVAEAAGAAAPPPKRPPAEAAEVVAGVDDAAAPPPKRPPALGVADDAGAAAGAPPPKRPLGLGTAAAMVVAAGVAEVVVAGVPPNSPLGLGAAPPKSPDEPSPPAGVGVVEAAAGVVLAPPPKSPAVGAVAGVVEAAPVVGVEVPNIPPGLLPPNMPSAPAGFEASAAGGAPAGVVDVVAKRGFAGVVFWSWAGLAPKRVDVVPAVEAPVLPPPLNMPKVAGAAAVGVVEAAVVPKILGVVGLAAPPKSPAVALVGADGGVDVAPPNIPAEAGAAAFPNRPPVFGAELCAAPPPPNNEPPAVEFWVGAANEAVPKENDGAPAVFGFVVLLLGALDPGVVELKENAMVAMRDSDAVVGWWMAYGWIEGGLSCWRPDIDG